MKIADESYKPLKINLFLTWFRRFSGTRIGTCPEKYQDDPPQIGAKR
jgi:hypothetical protein